MWDNSVLGTEREARTRPSRCYHCGGSAFVEADPNCPVCGPSVESIQTTISMNGGKPHQGTVTIPRGPKPWNPPVVDGKGEHGNILGVGTPFSDPTLPVCIIDVWCIAPFGVQDECEGFYQARLGHFLGPQAPHPTQAVVWLRRALESYLETAKPCPACGAKYALQPYDRMQQHARCSLGCGAIFEVVPDESEDDLAWRAGDRVEAEPKKIERGPKLSGSELRDGLADRAAKRNVVDEAYTKSREAIALGAAMKTLETIAGEKRLDCIHHPELKGAPHEPHEAPRRLLPWGAAGLIEAELAPHGGCMRVSRPVSRVEAGVLLTRYRRSVEQHVADLKQVTGMADLGLAAS